MKIIAVDDERAAVNLVKKVVEETIQGADVVCFGYAEKALEYAKENIVDIAFIDINMPVMNGLTLAKKLKDIYAKTNIIFVTGYETYVKDAFSFRASGYVLKPIDSEQVKNELENLRNPIELPNKGIFVQCFGRFEVFMDGEAIVFGREKAKEALAYLVDRKGVWVSKKELVSVLWEDRPYSHSAQSHIYVLLTDISNTLRKAGADDFINKKRGYYCVDTTKISCDYYNYEKGDIKAINAYRGEYMNNYSWAEITVGWLNKHV